MTFSEVMTLDCEVNKFFSCSLVEQERWLCEIELGISSIVGQLGSDKIPACGLC